MGELWQKTLSHLSEGNFTALQQMLGGPDGFDRQIVEWYEAGKFENEPDMLAEALSCACMLGRTESAAFLIDSGVEPYAGMKTGLAGPHYAVSGGHVEMVGMLIDRGVPLEVENAYGGTMLGQALWSAINEPKENHAEVIEILIAAGAHIWPGTLEWWHEQKVASEPAKRRIAKSLRNLATKGDAES